jgi:hypothetical protein
VYFFVEFYAQQSTAKEETFCAFEKNMRIFIKTSFAENAKIPIAASLPRHRPKCGWIIQIAQGLDENTSLKELHLGGGFPPFFFIHPLLTNLILHTLLGMSASCEWNWQHSTFSRLHPPRPFQLILVGECQVMFPSEKRRLYIAWSHWEVLNWSISMLNHVVKCMITSGRSSTSLMTKVVICHIRRTDVQNAQSYSQMITDHTPRRAKIAWSTTKEFWYFSLMEEECSSEIMCHFSRFYP